MKRGLLTSVALSGFLFAAGHLIACGGRADDSAMDGAVDATLDGVEDGAPPSDGACALDRGPVGAQCIVGSDCCSGACAKNPESGTLMNFCLYTCVYQEQGGTCFDGKPCCDGTCHPTSTKPPYNGYCTW